MTTRLFFLVFLSLFLATLPGVAGKINFTYDGAGRLKAADYGSGQLSSFQLDPNGNLVNRTTVLAATDADLKLTKQASTASIGAGESFTYTVTVTNTGPDPATRVIVRDEIPFGMLLTSASPSQGFCLLTGRMLSCDLGTLQAGETATIVLTMLHGVPGTVDNEASVHADQTDPNMDDNTDSDTSTGLAPADSDADGIPDWWEEKHGLNRFSSFGPDGADGDNDGDGVSNKDEFSADTDPNDPDSFFQIEEFEVGPAGVTLRFSASPIRRYRIRHSPNLATDPFVTLEMKDGEGTLLQIDHANTSERGFYEVIVEEPTSP